MDSRRYSIINSIPGELVYDWFTDETLDREARYNSVTIIQPPPNVSAGEKCLAFFMGGPGIWGEDGEDHFTVCTFLTIGEIEKLIATLQLWLMNQGR